MIIAAVILGLGASPYLARIAANRYWLRRVERQPEALAYALDRATRAYFAEE